MGCFEQSQDSVFKCDQPSELKIYPIRSNPHHLLDGLFHVTSKKHRSIRLFNLLSQIKPVPFQTHCCYYHTSR